MAEGSLNNKMKLHWKLF